MTIATSDRVRRTRKHAEFYRGHGWNALPSDPTPAMIGGKKKPLVKFRDYWKEPAPSDLFDRFPGSNIQVMTGTFWRLAVLDLDGAEAIGHAENNWRKLPRTWVSYHSNGGRDSRHYWFRLPSGCSTKGKTVVHAVWDETACMWKKHVAAELLVDKCLVTAPPSVHIRTGNEYQFEQGFQSMLKPALLPQWLWDMPSVIAPKVVVPVEYPRIFRPSMRFEGRATSRQVLDAIPDKTAVVKSWGLRVTTQPGTDGWMVAHDFNREDSNPSASFHPDRGHFWRPGMAKVIGLFELGTQIGAYATWQDCRDALATQYLSS